VALVLGLTLAGFIVARVLAERDARHESERRVAIAGAQIESRLEAATSLTASLSRFMLDEGTTGVTNDEFTRNALRWLSPAGLPAAAWAEEVRAADRPAYERRIGRPIVAPDERRTAEPSGSSYLPASLVSGFRPLNARGVDLSREPGIIAALGRAIRPRGVGATPIAARTDGTRGVFLVAPAPNLIDGVLRPGAVVVFLSEATLRSAARNPAGLSFFSADGSSGDRAAGDTVRDEFAVAGQQFAVITPKQSVTGPGAVLPWIILAGDLLLAGLAAELGVIAVRRARAHQDFDCIFNLSPDLVAVADFDGHFTRVNPAAEQVLGYTEKELLARPYLDFVHPDDRDRTAAEAAAIGQGKTTLSFENRLVRKDGCPRVFEWTATPVVEDAIMYGMARDVTERRRAESESERLAAEQAALRRVAELVAQQAPPEQVFTLVTAELSHLLDVNLVWTARFEPDGSATVLATRGRAADRMPPGTNIPLLAGGVFDQVLRTGRPARLDNYAHLSGLNDAALLKRLREDGLRCGAGGPIVVEGRVWGAMLTASESAETLPSGIEDRIAQFAELVSTAISNVESRARVERLAAEQSALRRVAERIAAQPPPDEVFALVTQELGRLLGVDMVRTIRFEPDGSATVMAASGMAEDPIPPGTNAPIPSGSVIDKVSRTSRPARVDDYAKVGGPIGARLGEQGVGSAAGGPIVVDGRLWGAMVACKAAETLPPDTEERVAQFAELVSTAISNVESRNEVERLAAEQSALRRVAELIARQAPSEQVFDLVTDELSHLLDVRWVRTVRFEPDGSATILAARDAVDNPTLAGANVPVPTGSVVDQVIRTARPARVDYLEACSPIGGMDAARCGAAGPIVVEGRLWGAMVVGSETAESLPSGSEDRVAQFAELVSTAISNVESRTKVERLATEQSALRRVATLVAGSPASERLFSTVAREVASVLNVPGVVVERFEADGASVIIGAAYDSDLSGAEQFIGVGTRTPPDPGSLTTQVFETHRAARVDYFSTLPGAVGDAARAAGVGSGCAGPIVVNRGLWGMLAVFSRVGTVLPVGTEDRLHDFIELVATAIANYEAHVGLAASEARARELAEEQAALRRVATLVAEGATPNRVFDAVRGEVEQMFGIPNTILMRFDPDGMATLLATPGDYLGPVGKQWPLDGDDSAVTRVYRTGRAARADYTGGAVGPLAEAARSGGTLFPVAVPVVVDGALWGAMSVGSRGPQPPPPDLEGRLAKFTELLATAVANAESRADLAASEARARELANEQAALRRVATLVAHGASPDELFSAVSREAAAVIDIPIVSIQRYEADGTFTILGNAGATTRWIGTRWPIQDERLEGIILATGRPSRWDDFNVVPGPLGDPVREALRDSWQEVRSVVGVPIIVDGSIWGFMSAAAEPSGTPIPAGTEERLARFTELIATAVSNATTRTELLMSRARVVSAADETRRRLERDLHDGIQQRLIALALRARKAAGLATAGESVVQELSRLGDDLVGAIDELREISRGIHPAILSDAGLDEALNALARRSPIPVDIDVAFPGRYDPTLEATMYYVAAESITNAVKHAQASTVTVRGGRRGGALELEITDDGVGGVDPRRGTGLIGLRDRVDTLGGTISYASPAGAGTAIRVTLPCGPRDGEDPTIARSEEAASAPASR
jgi:PAS domain S-box-containing protein